MPQGTRHAPHPSPADDELLSIGDLAEAAGISPDTIRAWERRYGRPEAVRLPSGHRRYTPAQVRWLRRVAEALAHGHRPAGVVHLSDARLDAILLGVGSGAPDAPELGEWLEHVRAFDAAALRRELSTAATRLGARSFLHDRVAPLTRAVGRAWADGDLDIRHEHFVTEILEDTLRGLRTTLASPKHRPTLVLATLPGELHALGMHMTAVHCALAGVRTHILGTETPLDELVRATEETDAAAVGISVSLATGGVPTDRALADLRRRLPVVVRLLVGGAGARGVRRGPQGVEYFRGWSELDAWLASLADSDDDDT